MPFNNGGSDYFKPQDGTYIGCFKSYEDGPVFDQERTQADGSVKQVKNATIRWYFDLFNAQTQQPVIDPTKNEPAVSEGLTGDSLSKGGRFPEAKARTWFRALYTSKGQVYPEAASPSEVADGAIGAYGVLTYEGGKLKTVGPLIGVTMPATATTDAVTA